MKYGTITFALLVLSVLAYPLEYMDITDTPRPSPAFEARQIDVVEYNLEIRIDPDTNALSEIQTTIDYVKLNEDTVLIFDFEYGELDSEWSYGTYYLDHAWHLVDVNFQDSIISINTSIDTASSIGDTCRLAFFIPSLAFSSGIYRDISPDGPVVYTLFWPSLARRVFPCIDHPADRATCTMKITTPEEVTVAAGGELIDSTTSLGDSTIVVWTFRYDDPVCTYNISFAAGNYAAIETTALGGSLPVKSYAYPSDPTDTEYDFARIPQMIELYDSLFGDYPFTRAGCVVTPMAVWGGMGGMEHQMLPNIGDGLVTGTRTYEEVVAHEMSHQWFGDCIGIAEWADFWLNEGIAVYSEVLWVEHTEGEDAAKTYMTNIESNYRTYATYYDDFPIYDPENYLSYIPYNKAASWWHMLRWIIGDEDFFDFLHYYFDQFAYKTVVTDSLQLALEDFTGDDWGWYMDQWIYSQGYPKYGFYIESRQDSLGWFIDVWLKQTQSAPMCTLFTMPVPLEINAPDSTWEVVFSVDARTSYERFRVPDTVEYILFDHRNAICGTFTYDPTAAVTETDFPEEISLRISPNPFNAAIEIESPANAKIEIYDILGVKIDELKSPATLRKVETQIHVWKPSPCVVSGIYFVKSSIAAEIEVRKAVYIK